MKTARVLLSLAGPAPGPAPTPALSLHCQPPTALHVLRNTLDEAERTVTLSPAPPSAFASHGTPHHSVKPRASLSPCSFLASLPPHRGAGHCFLNLPSSIAHHLPCHHHIQGPKFFCLLSPAPLGPEGSLLPWEPAGCWQATDAILSVAPASLQVTNMPPFFCCWNEVQNHSPEAPSRLVLLPPAASQTPLCTHLPPAALTSVPGVCLFPPSPGPLHV